MAMSSLSLTWASRTLPNKANVTRLIDTPRSATVPALNIIASSEEATFNEESHSTRRPLLLGAAALASSIFPTSSAFAQDVPQNYRAFVDAADGYTYYYPSDWREFDFRGHDSAFKDRFLQLQNVRVSFIPTDKADIHDLGPMEEVISNLVRNIYSAPSQVSTIYDMQEKTVDGKNYYTFEYNLTSPNFTRTAFATIAIANGRFYTLIVGANDRRWRRVRNKLKVVADSFKVLDI
ncbi:PsbP, C-terminal [Dillenia turbinata]|uniref:PsbP, C-terminal n=1 Tax=Dillenia turbinata TaxID=194707 RepID=A0AAN8VTN8_9MAGN